MAFSTQLDYRIRHFSPAWFATLMGVGQTAAVLHNFPFGAHWLRVFGIVIWGISIAMFIVFNLMFIVRFIKYPSQFKRMMKHPGQSAFLGCYPMGFATIINMIHFIWGKKAWIPVYVLWWIDVILSLLCTWAVVFYMMTRQKRTNVTLNATILLPIVTVIVAAATGGLIAPAQPIGVQPSTIIVSFLLWANGQALALSCIGIYLYRLYVENLPPRIMAFSSMLPIGPLGQGSFGIMCIAKAFGEVLKRSNGSNGDVLASAVEWGGVIVALFLVGYGTFWVVFCLSVTIYQKPTTFHMSWWGLTFPLGTYVVAWYKLAEHLEITTFKVIGAFWGVFLMMTVLGCTIGSIYYGIMDTRLFDQVKAETWPVDEEQGSSNSSEKSKV